MNPDKKKKKKVRVYRPTTTGSGYLRWQRCCEREATPRRPRRVGQWKITCNAIDGFVSIAHWPGIMAATRCCSTREASNNRGGEEGGRARRKELRFCRGRAAECAPRSQWAISHRAAAGRNQHPCVGDVTRWTWPIRDGCWAYGRLLAVGRWSGGIGLTAHRLEAKILNNTCNFELNNLLKVYIYMYISRQNWNKWNLKSFKLSLEKWFYILK